MFGSILGWIGIGLGAIGAIGSFLAASDRSDALDAAAEQRNRAKEIEDRKNKIKARRERMKLIREARIKRAAAVANATAQGAVGSVRGGFGSIISSISGCISGKGKLSPIEQLKRFSDTKINAAQAKANVEGLVSYSKAMAKVSSASAAKDDGFFSDGDDGTIDTETDED